MADGITVAWEVIESFITDIAAALLDNALIPILQKLFDVFFTFVFVTLNNHMLVFGLAISIFLLVFYTKYVRNV